MAQIFGSGTPVNTLLPSVVDYNAAFAAKGLVSRWDFKAANITQADVSGTDRASLVSPVGGAGNLTQTVDGRKPEYVAGGGPNGLSDGLRFTKARFDRLEAPDVPASTQTRVAILRALAQPTVGYNGNIYGPAVNGIAQSSFYFRWNVADTPLLNGYVGGGGNIATASVAVPHDTWMLAIWSWDQTTRALRVGYRPIGALSVTWSAAVANTGAPDVVAASGVGLGANVAGNADALPADIAGAALFEGYAAHLDSSLLAGIEAWACGDNSIFGM